MVEVLEVDVQLVDVEVGLLDDAAVLVDDVEVELAVVQLLLIVDEAHEVEVGDVRLDLSRGRGGCCCRAGCRR